MITEDAGVESFTEFMKDVEPRLRHALCAAYGPQGGRDAVAHALEYGFEHWERVQSLDNPAGYLWRVGHNHARRRRVRRPRGLFPEPPPGRLPWVEPKLSDALGRLSERQRTVVMLVCGFEWTHAEVAELLGVSRSSVQTQLERGLARLRKRMGVRM